MLQPGQYFQKERRRKAFFLIIPWIFGILIGTYYISTFFTIKQKSNPISAPTPAPTPFIFNWDQVIWNINSEIRPYINNSRNPLIFGPFPEEIKKDYLTPLKNEGISYSLVKNCTFYLDGLYSVGTSYYPKTDSIYENHLFPQKPTYIEKSIPILIPESLSDSAKVLYFMTRLQSIPSIYLTTFTIIYTQSIVEIESISLNFGVTQNRLLLINEPIISDEMICLTSTSSNSYHLSAISSIITNFGKYLDSKTYSNEITLLSKKDPRLTNYDSAIEKLKTLNDRIILRQTKPPTNDILNIFYKSQVLISFMSEKLHFLPFMKPGSTFILVQLTNSNVIFPKLASTFGIRVYVIGLKDYEINDSVLECINKIINKEYPDEDNPKQIPDEEEIQCF